MSGKFRFRSLGQARYLSGLLAAVSPNPRKFALPLTELLVNAVEHGIASVTYKQTGDLIRCGRWEEEVQARLASEDFVSKYAYVEVSSTSDSVTYVVSDDGEGFQWEEYLQMDPNRAFDPHGRGIALAKMSFDHLEFMGTGSTVTAKVNRT